MSQQRVHRRLAAILAADVAAYSRLMGEDEEGTHAALRGHLNELFEPCITSHNGRLVKTTGDGLLVEFASVVDAVRCALAVQEEMQQRNRDTARERRLEFRIGIHAGDVISDREDIYGDGVNIAARLEALAEPGSLCLSGDAYRQVRGRVSADFSDLGEQRLKNIAEPVQVYGLRVREMIAQESHALRLPAKPSIAVLPFNTMSGDREQETFADGLTEDLITDLSRAPGLFVIARNSSFVYKGKATDVRQIARDLGVRYLLEGSARRSGGRVRVNAQLIDAHAGTHLWAERFDRELEDIFAVQDEVTGRIVQALLGKLAPAPARSRPAAIEAYDLCVRGRQLTRDQPGSLEAARESCELLRQAIAIEPNYAEALRWLAFSIWEEWAHSSSLEPLPPFALEGAEKAVSIDPNDAGNRWVLGYILAVLRRWPESDAEFDAALALDPNCADALAIRAEVLAWNNQAEAAIELVRRAFRLNPYPAAWYFWELGIALFAAGDYQATVETLRHEATYRTGSRRILAAALAELGRLDEARREAALFLAANPGFTIPKWAHAQPVRHQPTLQRFLDGYRKAGLPD